MFTCCETRGNRDAPVFYNVKHTTCCGQPSAPSAPTQTDTACKPEVKASCKSFIWSKGGGVPGNLETPLGTPLNGCLTCAVMWRLCLRRELKGNIQSSNTPRSLWDISTEER